MIETDVEIRKLLPIDWALRTTSLDRVFRVDDKELLNLPRIALVQYKDKKNFIVVDGHHRAARYLLAGKLLVPSKVLETDTDVKKCYDGALDMGFFETLERVRQEYEQFWKPGCVEHKVYSIEDLLKKHKREIRGLR